MKLEINEVSDFFEYHGIGTWIRKEAVDILVTLARVIKTNPVDFYWNKYYEEIESEFILNEQFKKIYNEIKVYLTKKEVQVAYQNDEPLSIYIRFYLVVKLQVLLMILNDCEYIGKENSNIYYNTQDIDCIKSIYTTLTVNNFDYAKEKIQDLANELKLIEIDMNNSNYDESINIANNKDVIDSFASELMELKSKEKGKFLYISYYALRYKYMLIGIEKIIFDFNKKAIDSYDIQNIR